MDLPEPFKPAEEKDIPALEILVNSAYRGETSKAGWTTEADLLDGIRTDQQGLREMIEKPGAIILAYRNEENNLQGCVYLEQQKDVMYLGMLTILPTLQGKGLGRQMMKVAEDYARSKGCVAVEMTVISARHELIAWYEKNGYQATGEKKPFPNDPRFGIPKRPLEFIVMRKDLD